MEIKDFKDLRIWQDSQNLMVQIYSIAKKFPKSEEYNLTSQLKRATLSCPTNIAEAFGRFHFGESNHFLLTARGSAQEVRSLLYSANLLGYLDQTTYNTLDDDYQGLIKGINALIKSTHKVNNEK